MKGIFITIIFILLFILSNPAALFSDYVMMCTFGENPVARVYKISDEGDIAFDYYLEVGGNPRLLCFAPNGKWGLVGSHTTYYPPTQNDIVLGVDKNREISVLGTAHNEYEELIAISPDSRYGVYGCDLKTLRFNNDNTFTVIPTENPILCLQAVFSKVSNNILGQSQYVIEEYTLLPDGRTTDTGFTLDISPSTGYWDLNISPDGRTLVTLSGSYYSVTVLRVLEQGGCSLVQQFDTHSLNAAEVDFTPDSKYAVISFIGRENLRIFRIGEDSKLTETDSITLANYPGEDMAVTPDGKYIVTRALINNYSYFYVVRIHEDGTLEYLPEKDYVCSGFVSAIAFVPPRITSAGNSWIMY